MSRKHAGKWFKNLTLLYKSVAVAFVWEGKICHIKVAVERLISSELFITNCLQLIIYS